MGYGDDWFISRRREALNAILAALVPRDIRRDPGGEEIPRTRRGASDLMAMTGNDAKLPRRQA